MLFKDSCPIKGIVTLTCTTRTVPACMSKHSHTHSLSNKWEFALCRIPTFVRRSFSSTFSLRFQKLNNFVFLLIKQEEYVRSACSRMNETEELVRSITFRPSHLSNLPHLSAKCNFTAVSRLSSQTEIADNINHNCYVRNSLSGKSQPRLKCCFSTYVCKDNVMPTILSSTCFCWLSSAETHVFTLQVTECTSTILRMTSLSLSNKN